MVEKYFIIYKIQSFTDFTESCLKKIENMFHFSKLLRPQNTPSLDICENRAWQFMFKSDELFSRIKFQVSLLE